MWCILFPSVIGLLLLMRSEISFLSLEIFALLDVSQLFQNEVEGLNLLPLLCSFSSFASSGDTQKQLWQQMEVVDG